MEFHRFEILPNIFLSCIKTDKFKTGTIKLFLLTPLDRKDASANALIPMVLRRGTSQYPDMSALAARLDELYGASIEAETEKDGEIQLTGFSASFCDERFIPGKEDVTAEMIRLLSDMLLRPVTKGGLLLQSYVENEKEKLCEEIDSRINNKRRYVLDRLIEEMCAYENYGITELGDRDSVESIHYVAFSKYYHSVLAAAPIEIFYCGSRDCDEIAELFHDSLITIPRGDCEYDLGTDIRMNAIQDEPRVTLESLPVNQGHLAVGFRLGNCMEAPDYAALYVFNRVYGGDTTSKLFEIVREKMSLCYNTCSYIYLNKGLLVAYAGIQADKYEIVRDELFHQLEEMKNGNISEQELSSAKKETVNSLRLRADSPDALANFYISNILRGEDISPEELAERAAGVSPEDVISIAQSVVPDQIYFLRNGEEE